MLLGRALLIQILAVLSDVCVSMGTPEAVIRGAESATGFILRDKRDPSRAMTFSGFMPGGAMSAFASSADFQPYFRSNRPSYNKWSPSAPVPAHEDGRTFQPAQGESPGTHLQPPQEAAGDEKHWNTEQGGEREGPAQDGPKHEGPAPEVPASEDASIPSPDEPKKPKKKYNHRTSPRDDREDDDDEYERPGPGGNAAASFNAWFPIMLGMFPPSVYQQPGDGATGYSGYGGSGSGSGQGRNPSSFLTTVVANSVSHGRNGIASSHAVAYGGGSPPQQQRPQNAQG